MPRQIAAGGSDRRGAAKLRKEGLSHEQVGEGGGARTRVKPFLVLWDPTKRTQKCCVPGAKDEPKRVKKKKKKLLLDVATT